MKRVLRTGGAGYVEIGYDANDQQITQNTYYISARTELPISQSATLNVCYGSTDPTYDIVLLAERPA